VANCRLWLLLIGLGSLLVAGCARQVAVQPVIDPADYPSLTVLPFDTESVFSTIGEQMADQIVLELMQYAPQFRIIERARVNDLLLERNLEAEGVAKPASTIEAARLLGVSAILTGSVSVSISDVEPAPEQRERVANSVAVVRLIDAADGRIIWAHEVQGDYSVLTYLYGEVDQVETDYDMVQEVIKEVARRTAQFFYPHTERDYGPPASGTP
jgi:TolB-like protein